MSTQTNQKIVVAVNKRLEPGVGLNAAAHCLLGLACGEDDPLGEERRHDLQIIDYATRDASGFLASALPLIVLQAKATTLARLRSDLLSARLPAVAFHEEMTGGTYLEQLERSRARDGSDLELFALATLGAPDALDPLTRRCSLY
jgi:hypothetical protein